MTVLTTNTQDELNRFRGCLIGLAVGDAVGTTVEFKQRGTFPLVTDMTGGGPFKLKPGQWTDDTSMALCLATSLLESQGFDAQDQMLRYCRWHDEGYLSSNGRCFDIGNTVSNALFRFQQTGVPFSGSTHAKSAGNGCLMRLAPVPMFFYPNRDVTIHMSGESARTTHGATECIEASQLFGAMLFKALSGTNKADILSTDSFTDFKSQSIVAIASGDYRHKRIKDIRGSGYVVESLEAALWCFHHTHTFEEAILESVNLGDDADTTAAICGQIAGAYYGYSGIPEHWKERLAMINEIRILADRLQLITMKI
jgi:ADP-ribosyl-[dinitrogen reductase] hydrolase